MPGNNHVVLIQVGNQSILRKEIKAHYKMPPIGLLNLASMLMAHGYSVKVVDLITGDYSAEALARELRRDAVTPLMIGLSIYTETANASLEVARLARTIFPNTKIVAGGPHPTFCVDEVLACLDVDFVVCGEGESTLIELLEAFKHPGLPLEQIAGICFRAPAGGITRTAPRNNITLLDLLPFPAYDLENLDEQRSVFRVVSSRGCPGSCMFCSSGAYSGSVYRMHSAEWLFSLVVYYYVKRSFQVLDVLDDTFTVNWRRTKRFCALLKASRAQFTMQVKSRVDFIREEVICALSEAGCTAIHIGVESADQAVLDSISKGITLEQVYSTIELMVKYGMRVNASFMIGHPSDTRESIERTLILASVINDLGVSAVSFATPFPGTRLHRDAARLGVTIAVPSWRKYDTMTPIYFTAAFDLNDLRRAYFMYVSYGAQIRGRTLLTNSLHTEYWSFLDGWKNKLMKLEAQARNARQAREARSN
jgi:radical SAM superfamily enzyme YgiQ (UPF0313 family)